MFQEGLFAFLSGQSSLTSLLGTSRSDGSNGIFPIQAPGNAVLPYIVYQRVSGAPVYVYDGADKFTISRFRISMYSSTQKGATKLAVIVRSILKNFVGTFADPDATVVQNTMLELEADDAESVPHGTIFACHQDYSFSYIDNA
ncbi:Uncharacterised protein [uncultured archaeon]|nr:Uncharacterised protein [uncultured archaeon]